MKNFRYLIFISFYLVVLTTYSQQDSAYVQISKTPDDTTKVKQLLKLSQDCYGVDYPNGIKYGKEALNISTKLNYTIGIIDAYNRIANNNLDIAKYDLALKFFIEGLKVAEKSGDKVKEADANLNIGIVHYYQGSDKVIGYWLKSLDIYQNYGDKEDVAIIASNLCGYYNNINKEEAIKYGNIALNTFREMKDTLGFAKTYINIAVIYIDVQLEDKELSNTEKEDVLKAIKYLYKSLYYKSYLEERYLNAIYSNLSECYNILEEYDKALNYAFKSLELTKKGFSKEDQRIINVNISSIYRNMNNYEKSLLYQDSSYIIRDEILNEANQKAIAEMETKYQTEKKEQKNALLQKDNDLKNASIKEQKIIGYAMAGGIFTLLLIATLIFHQFKQKKKANLLLTSQKNIISEKNEELNQFLEEIEAQRDQIEIQNKDLAYKNDHITSSIVYAKRIQEAILPSDELVFTNLKDSFVLYKPKDIVSGDFYWMEVIESKVLWAAVDCTGHGVPGAFMSILGSNGLKKIVNERHIYKPSEILTQLTQHVISSIKETKDGEEVKDGMDISLCCWDKSKNTLEWAGAYNPLWIIRNKEILNLPEKSKFFGFDDDDITKGGLVDIKATKRPIGKFKSKKIPDFVNHIIKLEKGDAVYVFTDGYHDQFGGEDGSKLTAKKMRNIILENWQKPMEEQKEILEQTFLKWQGKEEQLDDVCVFGVRI